MIFWHLQALSLLTAVWQTPSLLLSALLSYGCCKLLLLLLLMPIALFCFVAAAAVVGAS